MAREFILNTISSSSEQHDLGGLPQIPVLLSAPGVISLRQQQEPYKIYVGDKEI